MQEGNDEWNRIPALRELVVFSVHWSRNQESSTLHGKQRKESFRGFRLTAEIVCCGLSQFVRCLLTVVLWCAFQIKLIIILIILIKWLHNNLITDFGKHLNKNNLKLTDFHWEIPVKWLKNQKWYKQQGQREQERKPGCVNQYWKGKDNAKADTAHPGRESEMGGVASAAHVGMQQFTPSRTARKGPCHLERWAVETVSGEESGAAGVWSEMPRLRALSENEYNWNNCKHIPLSAPVVPAATLNTNDTSFSYTLC